MSLSTDSIDFYHEIFFIQGSRLGNSLLILELQARLVHLFAARPVEQQRRKVHGRKLKESIANNPKRFWAHVKSFII